MLYGTMENILPEKLGGVEVQKNPAVLVDVKTHAAEQVLGVEQS